MVIRREAHDLEMCVKGQSRSLKVASFNSFDMVSSGSRMVFTLVKNQ